MSFFCLVVFYSNSLWKDSCSSPSGTSASRTHYLPQTSTHKSTVSSSKRKFFSTIGSTPCPSHASQSYQATSTACSPSRFGASYLLFWLLPIFWSWSWIGLLLRIQARQSSIDTNDAPFRRKSNCKRSDHIFSWFVGHKKAYGWSAWNLNLPELVDQKFI